MRWLFSSEAKSFKPTNAFSLHLEVKGNFNPGCMNINTVWLSPKRPRLRA
jgi:hypothetical protein